jgi:hypothetical protein
LLNQPQVARIVEKSEATDIYTEAAKKNSAAGIVHQVQILQLQL